VILSPVPITCLARVCSLSVFAASRDLFSEIEIMSFVSKIIKINSVRTAVSRCLSTPTAKGPSTMLTRNFNLNNFRFFQTSSLLSSSAREEVTVTFLRPNGDRMEAKGKVGENLVRHLGDLTPFKIRLNLKLENRS
jgi:hypothetical protein